MTVSYVNRVAQTDRLARPRRLAASVQRATDVLIALARSDLRIRYGRGPTTKLKWLLDPFAALGIYLLLVTLVLTRHSPQPGLTLACAVVPFQLVIMTVVNALRAIELRRSIVANMAFPRSLIPLASVLAESAGFVAALPLLALMMVIYGVSPSPALLLLPVLIAATALLAAALAYPASLVGLWARELAPFVTSMVRAFFFLAPGLVALANVHGRAHLLLKLNPLTGLFEAYRSVLQSGRVPAAWELAVPIGFAVVVLAAAVPLYRSEQRHFAKALQ